jgi:hypothetical protein
MFMKLSRLAAIAPGFGSGWRTNKRFFPVSGVLRDILRVCDHTSKICDHKQGVTVIDACAKESGLAHGQP